MQKTIAIFLSVLLLSSTMGIAYGQHFCGGHLMKAMLTFSEAALDCGMEKIPATCEKETSKTKLHEKSCCDTELHQVDTDEHYSGSHFGFEPHKNFALSFVSIFVLNHFETASASTEITRYFPPPIDKDVQVLYQVFLI